MLSKYEMLINVLDAIRNEAPEEYKSYLPVEESVELLQKARSLAFIHLLLKVRFGVSDFLKRHQFITDGTGDGGVDAYYIDDEAKKLYFIQSKFRAIEQNFSNKEITTEEMIRMEISRITKGQGLDSNGLEFNPKIKAFQKKLQDIRDIAKYDYIVLFLCNLSKYNDEQIRRLIDNCNYEIFDAERTYKELIFPLSTGTYYNPEEIIIKINLFNKEHPKLKQIIETDFGNYQVTVLFVPTFEIAKTVSKYKNAVLKFNPRNFLSLKKQSVNERIKNSILRQSKNNFAILNNGITLLSDNVHISESTGEYNKGQLILTRPQILNGGQTAFTLSTVYDKYKDVPDNPLHSKEVLLKIITPLVTEKDIDNNFIQMISNSTNQQNEVSEADRRSNHKIQIFLQKKIFEDYGFFYERKAGEFHDGLENGIIDKSLVIDRLTFIKAYLAYIGFPAQARRSSEKLLFKEERFAETLHKTDNFPEMFYAYLLFHQMEVIENTFGKKHDSIDKYGYSILYGKWAVLASIGLLKLQIPTNMEALSKLVDEQLDERLNNWQNFDKYVLKKRKNTKYFTSSRMNYELYYKVSLLDEDIKEYFLK